MTTTAEATGSTSGTSPSTVVHTACTLDCPDACSLAVTVSAGRIVDIDASPVNGFTDGWICAKVKKHARRVYAPERVLTPLRRVGPKGAGEFAPISWGEAIDLVAARVRSAVERRGGDAVVAFTYNSSSALVEKASMTEALFAAIGAAHVEHTICAATNGAAWESVLGEMHSADPRDVVHSRLVVVWGANPTVSNTHWAPLVQRAVAAGARLVVVDPRRTAMAGRAHLHLAVRPGTDVVLALALANLWRRDGQLATEFLARHVDGVEAFLAAADEWTPERAAEVTGVPADDIRTLAEWWATTSPAMLRIGWGQERNANGGAACRAVLALPLLVGQVGAAGAGIVGAVRTKVARPLDRWPSDALAGPARRRLPLHQVGRWLAPDAGDPCEVLVVQGANPVVMCPDTAAVVRALARDDVFTVVHEQVLTDTTRYADVVLPATTAFEIDDLATSYGSVMVQPVRAVIERVGESVSNDELGLLLAAALGFDWSPPPVAAVVDDPVPREAPVPSSQFVDTFPGSSHGDRARLVDPVVGVPAWRPLPVDVRYPLTLLTPASPRLVNSMFGEFQDVSTAVVLHPDDATSRGLSAGDLVEVANDRGVLTVRLDVSTDVRPGVAVMAKGVWLRAYEEGAGPNLLCPDTGDELVNGACFNDAAVEVRAAPGGGGEGWGPQ